MNPETKQIGNPDLLSSTNKIEIEMKPEETQTTNFEHFKDLPEEETKLLENPENFESEAVKKALKHVIKKIFRVKTQKNLNFTILDLINIEIEKSFPSKNTKNILKTTKSSKKANEEVSIKDIEKTNLI